MHDPANVGGNGGLDLNALFADQYTDASGLCPIKAIRVKEEQALTDDGGGLVVGANDDTTGLPSFTLEASSQFNATCVL